MGKGPIDERGEGRKDIKRSDMCYVQVSTPHDEGIIRHCKCVLIKIQEEYNLASLLYSKGKFSVLNISMKNNYSNYYYEWSKCSLGNIVRLSLCTFDNKLTHLP